MEAQITQLLSSPSKLTKFYLSALLIVVVLFMLFEQRGPLDAIWWATMTGLGVGYADILPQTFLGQVLTVAWAHFMILGLVPLIVGYVILNIAHDKNEFTDEEQKEILNYVRSQQAQAGMVKGKK